MIQDYQRIATQLGRQANPFLAEALISSLFLFSQPKVLDIGCGAGGYGELILDRTGAQLVGIDLNLAMTQLARQVIPVIQADAQQIPFVANSFDAAYAINLLQLLPDRKDFFAEVYRLLVPGGKFGLPTITPDTIQSRYINRFFPSLATQESIRHPLPGTLIAELNSVGFQIRFQKSVDMGYSLIDRTYLTKLRSGILSGILLITEQERENGLSVLESNITEWERQGSYPQTPHMRTLVVVQKPG
jgi:SAM-dependent methyltransferase